MAKKALIVGINAYPSAPLRGCVNDANMMSEMLTKQFGFSTKEKRMLTDEAATTANILERLDWLVKDAKAGDSLFFHFSGHGSQMIDSKYDSDEEPDGLDEILCPVDLNWRDKVITDDMLKSIFNKVPAGVHLTVVTDCCHSGSILDHANQYQPLGIGEAREFGPDSPNRSRMLPMPADIANRGMGLDLSTRKLPVARDVDTTGMLVTGCQSNQTSADAWISNMYCGAATYSLISTLKRHNYDVSYKQLVDEMNQFMVTNRFSQRPELNGSAALFEEKFLGGKKPEGVEEEEPVVEEPSTPSQPEPNPPVIDTDPEGPAPSKPDDDDDDDGKKKDKKKIIIAVVIVVVIAAVAIFGGGM